MLRKKCILINSLNFLKGKRYLVTNITNYKYFLKDKRIAKYIMMKVEWWVIPSPTGLGCSRPVDEKKDDFNKDRK